MIKRLSLLALSCILYHYTVCFAQNPFLPLWEFVPDAEPYVFEDPDNPGRYRVYIYGSHDILESEYCGRNQVVWSAPVDTLTAWRYEGVSFTSGKDILYAPDVAMRYEAGRPVYYLYPNNQTEGRRGQVARSLRPAGPFEVINWNADSTAAEGILGFDPAVFVDDDGRAYAYWGFDEAWCAELDTATMCTAIPGTIRKAHVPSRHDEGPFRFYEASSMRKIADKYVFIYSRWSADGDNGLSPSNYTLAYAYGDAPLGPFTYGGTLIDGRAPITLSDGRVIAAACPWGNTHGSIFALNESVYYLIYHRQTGTNEYSRQTMVAPLQVKVEQGKGGRVLIEQAEYTSEGFKTEGLNPYEPILAAWASAYYTPSGERPFIRPSRDPDQPTELVSITDSTVVGFKYIHTACMSRKGQFALTLRPYGEPFDVQVLLGERPIAHLHYPPSDAVALAPSCLPLPICDVIVPFRAKKHAHKQPLTLIFTSPTHATRLCDMLSCRFMD